uniref:Uncharacterized protein n=1 Tax=Anguilla anguilla TaxID=7936 RepID=A0A0E9RSZ1_ANGAN
MRVKIFSCEKKISHVNWTFSHVIGFFSYVNENVHMCKEKRSHEDVKFVSSYLNYKYSHVIGFFHMRTQFRHVKTQHLSRVKFALSHGIPHFQM